MSASSKPDLKKNFAYTIIFQILNIAIPLITTPYITRILGADGIGVYSFAHSVAAYFVIFIMLGLNNYGNRAIAEVRDNRSLCSKTFIEIYSTQLFLGACWGALYFCYALVFSPDSRAALLLGFYVISSVFDINWFFNGEEKFKLTVTRNIVVKIICTLSIFLFVNSNDDVYIYCAILALSFLVSQIALWPYLFKEIDFVKVKWSGIKKHIKPNLVLFITVLAVSLFKIMDKIMLGIMASYDQVGFYESSEKVINIPIAFVTALGNVMLPRVTNMVSNKKGDDIKLLKASSIFAMWVTLPLCFGLMAVADLFVPLFYGNGFEECIALYRILLPSCVFLAFANVVRTQYLIPHRMDREYVISAFIGAGVNLTINLSLIYPLKSQGAAIGTLIAEMAVCIYQCCKVGRFIPIHKFALLSVPAAISSVIMYFVLVSITFNKGVITQIAFKVLLGMTIYGVCLFCTSIWKKDEYVDVLKTLKKM